MEQEAQQVGRLYSTKSIHVVLGAREYDIPANYFGPKKKDDPNSFAASQERGFGFFLFLPVYGGYTKENWKDPFDRRRIDVLQVKTVDKNAMVPLADGTLRKVRPANYGEPSARFLTHKALLESAPSLHSFGLDGYRYKGGGATPGVVWTGKRSNGEFFFFECSNEPGKPQRGISNPLCQTQYFSEKEDLFVAYRYSLDHIALWREIDDAIWAKLHEWKVK